MRIPDQPCRAPQCGHTAELLREALFSPDNLDDDGHLMWATFKCPDGHGLVLPIEMAITSGPAWASRN